MGSEVSEDRQGSSGEGSTHKVKSNMVQKAEVDTMGKNHDDDDEVTCSIEVQLGVQCSAADRSMGKRHSQSPVGSLFSCRIPSGALRVVGAQGR